MPRLPRVSSKKVIRVLKGLGFQSVRQTGHVVLKKVTTDGVVGCVVPMHRELKIGTLSSILKQAKISPDDFIDHL
ncbi:type II toxin-antitoxin system HicA family toxin [Spirulina major CS-329]|uniref:type II toxin-antitoxin system HicA family toxin n=1 Tax=Spirulina TaxID=1154 RepID=UPI00232DFF97|nr:MULTISPECIES: type II toxin-antitoxin system HicA family toxin [Spirulina]MDB9495836.1 type II toxin-antitoxin system HicA family toxin [Spirulina subsalsa CS-330]MDB9504648.1 type II toxin-antitoxin system HicA family toxin [Spirulina major CS-329]